MKKILKILTKNNGTENIRGYIDLAENIKALAHDLDLVRSERIITGSRPYSLSDQAQLLGLKWLPFSLGPYHGTKKKGNPDNLRVACQCYL